MLNLKIYAVVRLTVKCKNVYYANLSSLQVWFLNQLLLTFVCVVQQNAFSRHWKSKKIVILSDHQENRILSSFERQMIDICHRFFFQQIH